MSDDRAYLDESWPPGGRELTDLEMTQVAEQHRQRQRREDEETDAFWTEQARLPLRQRSEQWWYGVALPNTILALVALFFLWIVVSSVIDALT